MCVSVEELEIDQTKSDKAQTIIKSPLIKHHDLRVVQVFPTEFIHLHSKEDYPLYPTGNNSGDQSLIDF